MFQVATLNMRHVASRWEYRLPLIAAGMLAVSPDLVALQEVSAAHGTGAWLQRVLNTRVGAGRRAYDYAQQQNLTNPEATIGILSRFPIRDRDWLDLQGQGRVALGIHVEPDGLPLAFVSTHLLWEIGTAGDHARRFQVDLLVDWVRHRFVGMPAILAGDFNATPDSLTYARMSEHASSLMAQHCGHEPEWTAPTPLKPSPDGWMGTLDYLFLLPGGTPMRVTEAKLFLNKSAPHDPTLYPSDHVGLLAALTWS